MCDMSTEYAFVAITYTLRLCKPPVGSLSVVHTVSVACSISGLQSPLHHVETDGQQEHERRHSHGILSTPQPLSQISVLTDPSFAKFHTPSATTAAAAAAASTRFSVGGRPSMVREVAFDEEEDEEAEEDSREHNLTSKREESSSEWENVTG